MDIEDKISQLIQFDKAYFEGNPIVDDHQYDVIKEAVRNEQPEHPYFEQVGAPVRGGKVKLPYQMGSLNQIYENDYSKWIAKYSLESQNIVITEKLDGMSVLLVYKGKGLRLSAAYSRGNGIEGADITRHISQMKCVPKSINTSGELFVVRAEVIMKNKVFDSKYSDNNKNARNMVAGLMNRKVTETDILNNIDLVAYEIVDRDNDTETTKEDDLSNLKGLGFLVANQEVHSASELSDAKLTELFSSMSADSEYELDGIVLTADNYSKVDKITKSSSLNPEHTVKFKNMSDDAIVETEVVDVIWKISKSGYFKPRVQIEPVELFGTTVTYATGFNGKYIFDNGIGPNARIKLTKAGAVIPYIVSVEKPVEPSMPEDDWCWDDLEVEIRSTSETSESFFMQGVHFFKTLSVEYLQETSLRKIYDWMDSSVFRMESFEDFVSELIFLFEHDWQRLLGANGAKSYNSLHKRLEELKPEILLGATPFFGQGFGTRKAKKIMKEMSLEEFLQAREEDIKKIGGFDKTSKRVVEGIPRFKDFLSRIEDHVSFIDKDGEPTSNELNEHVIVMSGFRDKELQERIEALGGRVASGVSKKTTILITADKDAKSSKIVKAKELGALILDKKEFELSYIL